MDQESTALLACLETQEDKGLLEELEEASFRAEVMEVVTQEELQAEGTLMAEILDFLTVLELEMVPEANPVDETQVTLMTMEPVEMITVEMIQVVMDTLFCSEVAPDGPLWIILLRNQEQNFNLSIQDNFTGKARELN